MSYSDINFSTKKVLGYANTSLDSTITYDPDPTKNIPSFQKISINQIYGQSIPASVNYLAKNNSDFGKPSLQGGLTFNGYIDSLGQLKTSTPTGAYGCLYTLNDSPHIQYVQSLPITNRLNKSSTPGSRTIFNIIITNTNTNIIPTNYFTNIIPFSYGPGYGYSLTQGYQIDSSKVMDASKQCIAYRNSTNNIVNPNDYVVDTDAGLLYIKNDDWNLNFSPNPTDYNASNGFPTLSFFRYNGKMGVEIPASSNATTPDVWSNVNIVGAPSAVSGTGTFTTTDAYYDFIYPTQIDSGIGLLPRIDTFYVNIYGIGDTGTTLITIPNTKATYGVTGSNYVSVTGAAGPTGSLFITSDQIVNGTGPIIIQGTGSGLLESSGKQPDIIQSINFSKTKKTGTIGISPLGLKCYSINYQKVTHEAPVPFYLWYGNGNRNPNVASYYFTYLKAGNPSRPQLSDITAPKYNSLSFGWTGSTSIDTNDPSSSANLIYKISYGPTGANNFRYGGIVNTHTIVYSTGTTGMTGGSNTVSIQSSSRFPVFPDTNYLVNIFASNSTLGTETGTFSEIKTTKIGTTGPPLLYTQQGPSTTNIPGTNLKSAKKVDDNTLVTNFLLSTSSPYTFIVPSVNIHNSIDSRGSTGTTLVSFTSSLDNIDNTTGFITPIQGPVYTLNGFGFDPANYKIETANGISILAGNTVIDQYASSTEGCDGYYLQNSMIIKASSAAITGSKNQYTLNLIAQYPNYNSGMSPCIFYSPFYYDGQDNGTVINGPAYAYPTDLITNFKPVCGIYVLTGNSAAFTSNINFTIEVNNITGLGNYFYSSDWILSYTNPSVPGSSMTLNPTQEKNLDNLVGIYSSQNSFKNTSVSITLNSTTSYHQGLLTLNVQSQNVHGIKSSTVTTSDKNSYQYIFDQPSLNLYAYINVPPNAGVNVPGLRVYSSAAPGTYEKYPKLYNNSYLASFTTYDNRLSLLTVYTYELLYANGKFCTPGLSPETYIDYSSGFYMGGNDASQLTYNLIKQNEKTGTRYATFVWTVPKSSTIFSSAVGYQSLNFTINSVAGINASGGNASANGVPIEVYYSVIDSGSPRIPSAQEKCITTYWINANSTEGEDGNLINANNCYIPNLPINQYIGSSSPPMRQPDSTTITFKVTSGGYAMSSANLPVGTVYIFCRIGLPMSSPASFAGMSCYLTTS